MERRPFFAFLGITCYEIESRKSYGKRKGKAKRKAKGKAKGKTERKAKGKTKRKTKKRKEVVP